MAANTDKARKKKSNFSTTLSGNINNSAQTIGHASLSGCPTDTAYTLTVDRVDGNGTSTPTLTERYTGVVSSNNMTNCLRGEDGSTAQSHVSGAVVEDIWEAETWNDMVDAFLAEHSQAGAHTTDTIAEKTGGAGVTVDSVLLKDGGVTLGTGGNIKLAASAALLDANGNELFKFTQTASAVNEITIANAATGASPALNMSGGDTDVGLDIKMKGAGRMRKPTVVGITVIGAGTDTTTGDGKAFFRVPAELNGMNLTGVAMTVATAGTTNTTDVQLRRNRSGSDADMLSTKLTIDSTETDTSTAATAAVINTSNDDVATGDRIFFDVDAVSTTAAKGIYVEMRFELP